MHAAHENVGVSSGLAARQACEAQRFMMPGRAQRPLHVCLIGDTAPNGSEDFATILEEHWQTHDRVTSSRAFAQETDRAAEWAELDRFDCLVLMPRAVRVRKRQLEQIQAYCRRGGAIVAIRCTSQALPAWRQFHRKVLGGDHRGHCANSAADVELVEAARHHPVLQGVEPFASQGTLERNPKLAPDATVLLTSSFPGRMYPVAWVRPYHDGRVFYTSLGHAGDFRQRSFLRLLTNGLRWTCGPRF